MCWGGLGGLGGALQTANLPPVATAVNTVRSPSPVPSAAFRPAPCPPCGRHADKPGRCPGQWPRSRVTGGKKGTCFSVVLCMPG